MNLDLRPSTFDQPRLLWLIRHGESTANVARHKAEAENLPTINFPEREPDIPLSAGGEKQSAALGKWFSLEKEKPSVIFSSPYLRSKETARLVLKNAKLENVEIIYDERLRERELGIFDRLTRQGAMQKFPEETAKREKMGKFYYRPIGGESWVDVAFRTRNFWRDLKFDFAGENVLIITHEVIIRLFRYIIENLSEEEILAIDRACDVENCAVTSYNFEARTEKLVLSRDNFCIK